MLVSLVRHLIQSKSLRSCKGLRVYILWGPLPLPRCLLSAPHSLSSTHTGCAPGGRLSALTWPALPLAVAWPSPPAGLLPGTPLTLPTHPKLPPLFPHCLPPPPIALRIFFPICSFIFCLSGKHMQQRKCMQKKTSADHCSHGCHGGDSMETCSLPLPTEKTKY